MMDQAVICGVYDTNSFCPGPGLLRPMFGRLWREGENFAVIWVLAANPEHFFYHETDGVLAADPLCVTRNV